MKICTQGIEWDFLYVMQMSKPQTFQELATKAHDMEVTIANHHGNSFDFVKLKKDKAEFRRNVKFSKNLTKEAMFMSKAKWFRLQESQNWKRKGAELSRIQQGGIPR